MKRLALAFSVIVATACSTASAQEYTPHSGLFGHHGYRFGNYTPAYTSFGNYGYRNYGYASNGYQPSVFRRYTSFGGIPTVGYTGQGLYSGTGYGTGYYGTGNYGGYGVYGGGNYVFVR